MTPVQIIAELGGIAEGRLATMIEQVRAAKQAGCTHVKAQWLSSAARLVERRRAQAYAGAYESLAFPEAHLKALREVVKAEGMGFMCTAYLPEDIPTLVPLVDRLKIASFEAHNATMVEQAARTGAPVCISTGMMENHQVVVMLARLLAHSRPTDPGPWVLHCVSAYPAPLEALNLRAIQWIATQVQGGIPRGGTRVGFSDHSAHVGTGALAVAAGAQVLEVHMRLHDSNPGNPDYATALDPGALLEYVKRVREAEGMLGYAQRSGPVGAEDAMRPYIARD